jgi:hypothetical protein
LKVSDLAHHRYNVVACMLLSDAVDVFKRTAHPAVCSNVFHDHGGLLFPVDMDVWVYSFYQFPRCYHDDSEDDRFDHSVAFVTVEICSSHFPSAHYFSVSVEIWYAHFLSLLFMRSE